MCVDMVCSTSKEVLSVVSQGSVLGNVLCLVYVNFLTEGLVSNFGAFADDFKIFLHYNRKSFNNVHGVQVL